MLVGKHIWTGPGILVVCLFMQTSAVGGDESPRATLQAAIKAHGGAEKLARTLTGTLLARGESTLAPEVRSSISWEETFELPRRYRRSIKGQFAGEEFSMEYAVTDGKGWVRQNGGEPRDYQGDKRPLSHSWNAVLGLLPSCLGEGVKLGPGGREKVEGREAIGVRASGDPLGGEAVLFFDARSGLLVKSKRRVQHPLSRKEVDGETVFGDYKEVSGVQYPHRITTYMEGKKATDMTIIRIELLKKVEDRLFDKP
jgi:hypothetical protein